MCVTATVALIAGGSMQALSQIQQGRVAKAQAEGEQAMAEHNRQVELQNAKAAELKARFDSIRQVKKGQRIMGTLRADLGASGLGLAGAPEMALEETADELALENALIWNEGMTRAGQYKSQAGYYAMEGELAGMRAKSAMPTAIMGAAGTALSTYGTAKTLAMGRTGATNLGKTYKYETGGSFGTVNYQGNALA